MGKHAFFILFPLIPEIATELIQVNLSLLSTFWEILFFFFFNQVSFKVPHNAKAAIDCNPSQEERSVFENEASQRKRTSRNGETKSYDLVSIS